MNIQSYDVTIIGGGMVGLALACALGDTDIRVAVLQDRTPSLELGEEPEIRVSAINQASKNLLTKVGAWPAIENARLQPYEGMQVWDADSFGKIAFDAAQLDRPELGAIVENTVIQNALWQRAEQLENVTLLSPVRCQNIAFGEQEAWLTLDNGQSLTSRLVVGADGANSWLRQQADIPLTSWDYGHHALVATIETDLPHDAIARQVFLPDGPLAFLPLWRDNQCSIVWSLPPDQAQKLSQMPEIEFNRRLTAAFDNRLGYCEVKSQRGVFPLKMRFARSFAKQRLALVGDAAHTIHPLAGLGVNLGFLDAASLAETILDNFEAGKDIGELAQLRRYERWRKAEAVQMITAMESLKRLFAGGNPLQKLIRDVGLVAVDKTPPIKDIFVRHAMGLGGNLPRLSREENS